MDLLRKVKRWRQDRKRKGGPYLIPLEELIAKCEARMKVKPKCPQCESLMYFRHSSIVYKVFPIRDDTTYKCIKCFHTIHFGNPMTREDALEEVRLRGGSKYLSRPTMRNDERDNEIIKDRLRKLGYIE